MPSFRVQADLLDVYLFGFKDELDKNARRVLREAFREFVRVASKKTPVDTGMARGAYLQPASDVGLILNITPVSTKKRYYHAKGVPSLPKNSTTAQLFTNYVPMSYRGHRYTIGFSTDIRHSNLLELNRVKTNPNSPWLAFATGQAAMTDYLRKNKNIIPDLKKFLVKTTLVGDKSGVRVVKSSQATLRS